MTKTYIALALITIGVLTGLVYAFTQVGSPTTARNQKSDQTRVDRLRNITYKIESYYSVNNRLPENLSQLTVDSYSPMTDPDTDAPFIYEVVSDLSYKLCATFYTSTLDEKAPGAPHLPTIPGEYETNFFHPEGYHCFTTSVKFYSPPYNYQTPTPIDAVELSPTVQ